MTTLEHHDFTGARLTLSRVEVLSRAGWIETGKFPATARGLRQCVDHYERQRERKPMGVALWIGPTLAACELDAQVRQSYGCGEPARTSAPIVVDGESIP